MSTRWLPSEAMVIASHSQASALKTTNLSTKELARGFPSQSFLWGAVWVLMPPPPPETLPLKVGINAQFGPLCCLYSHLKEHRNQINAIFVWIVFNPFRLFNNYG